MPGRIANGTACLDIACAAAARCSSLNASRFASAAVRRSAFDRVAVMRGLVLPSSASTGFRRNRSPDGAQRNPGPCRNRAACPGLRFAPSGLRWARRSNGNAPKNFGNRPANKSKCEAANAVEALDPGVPYESRWAPYVRIHGPGQGQYPKGSIRPRGYMAPDAQRSFAMTNLTTLATNRQP